ncbi:MAG: ligand-gated channel [Novosphingobium sp.]|nr:ligand-gated channel [Novosphingobium sp.]
MKRTFAVGLMMSLLSTTAWAQTAETPPAAQPPAAQDDSGGLQDIVVTARRREETAQNVPVSVTAISRDELERRNLTSLEDIAASIPQLTIARAQTGSGAQIFLRGIGSNPGSIGIEQSVAVVVDSVYYGQGRTINEGFFDLANLEVLKGPQSLFFGKNATAGVIAITTASPGDHTEIIVRGGYEFRAKQVYGEAIYSAPITDNFGIRVALRASKQFGALVRNDAGPITYNTTEVNGTTHPHIAQAAPAEEPQERELLGRITLKWQPTSRLTATLKATGSLNDVNNSGYTAAIASCSNGKSFFDKTTPCNRDFVLHQNNMPADIAANFPLADPDGATFSRYKSYAVTGNVEYAFDPLVWTTVLNYNYNQNHLAADADNQSYGPINVYATELSKYHAFSAESRVQTKLEGPLNALLGLYYQSSSRYFEQYAAAGNFENPAAGSNRYVGFSKLSQTQGKTLSAYGQLSWKILPRLELTAGGRYIHETKNSYFVHPYADPRLATRYRVGEYVYSDQTFNNFSPEATLTWRPTDDLTIYGAYKSAYKSGGFSNSGSYTFLGSQNDLSFQPETVHGGEIGFKSTLFDRQLRFNVAAYHYVYKNYQIDFINSITFNFITTNAGSVKQDGIEAEFQFAPRAVRGLQLRGSVNYNNSRYGEFIAPCYTGQTPALGCTLFAYSGARAQDDAGRQLNTAPKWVASLGATYQMDVAANWRLELGVDGRYSGSYLASSYLNPLSYQGQYANVDATLRLTRNDSRLQFALIGKNLTNVFVVTGAQDAPSTGSGTGTAAGIPGDQRSFFAPPRTVAAQITFHY